MKLMNFIYEGDVVILNYLNMIVDILLGVLLGLGLSPLTVKLAKKLKLIDDPSSSPRKIHNKPVPRAGGMVLFLGLVIAVLIRITQFDAEILKILLSASLVFITGLIDDHKSISVFQKFLGQFVATTILIILGIHVNIFGSLRFSLNLSQEFAFALDMLITYLWMIGLSNAFNFVDSMDGLLIQLSEIAILFIGISAVTFGQGNIAMLMIFLLGLLVSMSIFNSHPAIYFMGDSGALFLGFILAAVAIQLNPIDLPQVSSWFLPITFFTVPLFDMFLVVVSRIRHKTKFYKAGTDHTYHRLCLFGLSSSRAIEVMKLESLLWGFVGMIAIYQTPTIANVLFGLFLLNFVISYLYLDSKKKETPTSNHAIFYDS